MKQKIVLLGLSGGVDSSVSAFLLKKQGYKVIGAFLKMFSDTKNKLTGECSWIEERKMAQKIASLLDIQLITLDFEEKYKEKVIEPMFKEYNKGLTPNPDILCNTIIKFPLLWKEAKKRNIDYISTGHYARIKKTAQGFSLLKGKDGKKDQSYFLAGLTQEDLSHTLFPIGNYKKEEVRKIAKQNKLPNWDKQGTRGICFVGKMNMQEFLKQKIKSKEGNVVDLKNQTIGTHKGYQYYTTGQKAGEHIGISIKKPKEYSTSRFYISAKDKKTNTVQAVPENSPLLWKKKIKIKNIHLINPKRKIPKILKARIRHLGELHPGSLSKNKKEFTFNRPVSSIAEGQYLVLYNKEEVVASGKIYY